MSIISIDPGLRVSGVALWQEHQNRYYLERAWLAVGRRKTKTALPESLASMLHQAHVGATRLEAVIIELPQVYTIDKSKGDPNDLIKLATVVGGLAARYWLVHPNVPVELPFPADWKGQAPKAVVKRRCQLQLTEHELSRMVLPTRTLQHNVWDAVGIGLWYLKKNKLRSVSPNRSRVRLTDQFVV